MSTEIDLLMEMLKQHAADDTRRFEAQHETLAEIRADVKTLVSTEHRWSGIRAAVVAVAGLVGTAVSGLFALVAWYLK